jgi:hypothetical protein
MAKIFKLVNPSADVAQSYRRIVDAGAAATIAKGVPTKQGSTGYAGVMADGEGTTSERFTGIAKSTSTETASVDGIVHLWFPFPGVIYAGKPLVPAAVNTQAKIDALVGNRVVFDLTSSDWTIETAASDAIGNAVVIVGGQPEEDTVYFCVTHTIINFFENN